MDLNIVNKAYIVGGAGAGFGRSISEQLAENGAKVLAISRTESKLKSLKQKFPDNIDYICGDIMDDNMQKKKISTE